MLTVAPSSAAPPGRSTCSSSTSSRPGAGSTDAQGLIDLINAVIDRQGNGVEVKIIMSEFEKAGYLEQLHLAIQEAQPD